jgi:hypothetical protein
MQNRYSIQLFSTKKAALDRLDTPPAGPPDPEPTQIAARGNVIAFPGRRVG